MRVEQQPAYLLHAKKISDSRLLVDCLTRDYGVIGAVARAPSKKKSPLVPFVPASISWLGKTELKTLSSFELFSGNTLQLVGKPLYCGFYLNELVQRLMVKGDECPELYGLYQESLLRLTLGDEIESLLRRFEFMVLDAAGYPIDLTQNAVNGLPVVAGEYYRVQRNLGLVPVATEDGFEGEHLLKISEHNYHDEAVRRTAKQLSRMLIRPLLGSRPLKSRELFLSMSNFTETS